VNTKTNGAKQRTNWAGNHVFAATELLLPASVAEIQAAVRGRTRLKALGVGHSFNAIADTAGCQLSLRGFDDMALDAAARTVTVGAGVTYGRLAPWLDAQGFAVPNLASLPHISVLGACATGTHGSGVGNGGLATAVVAFEMVDGTGAIVRLSREDDLDIFAGTVVALGALGIVTSVTLNVVPRFTIAQTVYEGLSFAELEQNLRAVLSSGYSVSLFTDWQDHRATQVWLKQRSDESAVANADFFYGARLQQDKLHPLTGMPAENCTEQFGVPGPWYERLPHFRMEFTPSSGAELQTEYFVPLEHGWEAIKAVETLRDSITPLLIVSELRAIAADDLWLSMAYKRESLALHFTWKPEWAAVRTLLPLIEEKLVQFGARPHWAKMFTIPALRIAPLYARFDAFTALRKRFDPENRFSNGFLEDTVGT
jgi:xylitol oxidase